MKAIEGALLDLLQEIEYSKVEYLLGEYTDDKEMKMKWLESTNKLGLKIAQLAYRIEQEEKAGKKRDE